MANVCCRNNQRIGQCLGLTNEDHVYVDGIVVRGRLTSLAGLCPSLRGATHRSRRNWQIFRCPLKSVEATDTGRLLGTQQLRSQLVVDDLGHDHPNTGGD